MANFQFLQNIEALIAKYLREELSEPENAALQEWIDASPANKAKFEELTNKDRLIEKIRIWQEDSSGKDDGWRRIEQRLEGRPVKLWFRLQWTTIAATVLLMILGATVWFWLQSKKQKTEHVPMVQNTSEPANDVTPGGFKAKLTLADGSVVAVDSFSRGRLVQGSTNIYNKDGKLVYEQEVIKSHKVLYNTLTTAKGEMYGMVLSDGSKVWLNSESSVRYPVSVPANQQIDVTTTGEVFFDIVHNPKRKFNITVNGLNIDDIGTQFNVNGYLDEDNIKVTLIEGSVRVSKGDKMALLKRGQQAIARKIQNDNTIKVLDGTDLEKVIAWKNGLFKFNNDDLKTVMRQLARWYDLNVVYQGDVPKGQFIGTVPRNLNLSQVLEILESSDVHFKIEGKKLIVTP